MVGPWIHYLEKLPTDINPIFDPGKVWSDQTGKIYDVKEPEC